VEEVPPEHAFALKPHRGAAAAAKFSYWNSLVFETPHSAGEEKRCRASLPSA
jgi:hypothetical protein